MVEIGTIRLIEDSIAFILLSVGFFYLIKAALGLKKTPVFFQPIALLVGLFPLYIWKAMGAIRRGFLEAGVGIEPVLHDIGEVFESVSGLVLALAILYILFKLKDVVGGQKAGTE